MISKIIWRIITNIPSQIQGGSVNINLSLENRSWKRTGGWVFVKISASWSIEEIEYKCNIPPSKY